MKSRIEIRIQQEQELSLEAIEWIVCTARAIIRAFDEGYEQKMTKIAKRAGLSRQTLYSHLHMAIESPNWFKNLMITSSLNGRRPRIRA